MNNTKQKTILLWLILALNAILLVLSIRNFIRTERIYDIVIGLEDISTKDLKAVNNYIKELGGSPIDKQSAQAISGLATYYNKQTREFKNQWELIADFVNANEDEKTALGYEVVFIVK